MYNYGPIAQYLASAFKRYIKTGKAFYLVEIVGIVELIGDEEQALRAGEDAIRRRDIIRERARLKRITNYANN